MYIGIRESEVLAMVDEALAAAGLTERWALVLFGGNYFFLKSPVMIDVWFFRFRQKMLLSHMEAGPIAYWGKRTSFS